MLTNHLPEGFGLFTDMVRAATSRAASQLNAHVKLIRCENMDIKRNTPTGSPHFESWTVREEAHGVTICVLATLPSPQGGLATAGSARLSFAAV